jgi:hypothetical protein
MKKVFCLIASVALLASCSSSGKKSSEGEENVLSVTVENPSGFDRLTELVEIPLEDLEEKVTLKEGSAYIVKNAAGETVPSQLTHDGKLIFPSGTKAGESNVFTITEGAPETFKAKTYGRFITERKDDFAWENDRVAFRVYGPALIEIDGPSNGIDAWYKRTEELIIDKWYKNDLEGVASYHEDHGEGQDDYKVGRSLGAGAMAPYADGKLWLNENFASQEILDNGPLRTTFKLTYKDIEVNGAAYSETRTFSLDAGSQLTKITQEYGVSEPMEVAAGVAKREKNDSIIAALDKGYIVYAEPESEMVERVYLGLIFPAGMTNFLVDTYQVKNPKTQKEDTYSHVLGITNYQPGAPVTYYTGYGWSKFGFPTISDFQQYIENTAEGLKNPLVVKY